MTFSWTYLINVTLLDTATTNGCINNGLITFTDSPARNSNSLSALPCMPKTPGPNNQHCVWNMEGVVVVVVGRGVCICWRAVTQVKCTEMFVVFVCVRPRARAPVPNYLGRGSWPGMAAARGRPPQAIRENGEP